MRTRLAWINHITILTQVGQLLVGLVLLGLVDWYFLTLAQEAVTLGRPLPWQLIAIPLAATILWGAVAAVNIQQLLHGRTDKHVQRGPARRVSQPNADPANGEG